MNNKVLFKHWLFVNIIPEDNISGLVTVLTIVTKSENMKPLLFSLLFALCVPSFVSKAQEYEFTEYKNGLIYSDTTMSQLKFIVDSMNLKYKHCDPWRDYYSMPQTFGYYVTLDTGRNVDRAIEDLKYDIPLDDFMQRYPLAQSEKMLVVKFKYTSYEDEKMIRYEGVVPGRWSNPDVDEVDTGQYDDEMKGKWIYDSYEYDGQTSLYAFYIPDGFKSIKLNEKCSKLIQYVDCMIDTNEQVLLKDAKRDGGWRLYDDEKAPVITEHRDAFFEFVDEKTKQFDLPEGLNYQDKGYYDSVEKYRVKREAYTEQILSKEEQFKRLLESAVKETIANKTGDAGVEYYAARYNFAEEALVMKRSRRVIGGCSQDQRPRLHAVEIAKLSAKTVKWEVFLRAHLDIMNDRFESVAYSSIADEFRQTYIKELEELDFDVPSLILGVALRMKEPSGFHYYGSVHRLGRSIAESKYKNSFKQQMASIINDDEVDLFNRVLIFYLYVNYVGYTEDVAERGDGVVELKKLATNFPHFMRKGIRYPEITKE